MARISSAISGIERTLLNRLAEANAAIALSTLRKTTGHRITRPADDPAAFTALSGLQSQMTRTTAALNNATAAGNLISQGETVLSGITEQLGVIREQLLLDADGMLTPEQRAAAQAQIDDAITEINRLALSDVGGRQLFSGAADFTIAGRNQDQVAALTVYSTGGGSRTIFADVTQAATQATLTYTGTADDKIVASAEFTLAGKKGSVDITVSAGQTLASAAAAINQRSHETGVVAAVDTDTHTLTFTSVDYGTSATAAVTVNSGTFVVTGGDGSGKATGTNATAEINGIEYTGDGNRFSVSQSGLNFSIEFTAGFSGQTSTIGVSGEALSFALSPNLALRSMLAIPNLQSTQLGGLSGRLDQLASGGSLSGLGPHTSQAIRVVDEAIGQATIAEGRLAGFMNATVASASSLLDGLQTELAAAIEDIDGVDDEEEDTRIAYYHSLASNAVSSLSLLNQQRMAVVRMIQHLAGLS